ncbi:hypothetical protein HPULCUR_008219 [Helicostylum pulchrum]|uniref:Uncharacterized protein n=1 Tax=Helicostylum pulchrum TaxID=562976 RepID=A0ABP9Y815_9FUNG
MRAFSFIVAATAFATVVFADTIVFDHPVLADNVYNCIRDINAAANQYAILGEFIGAFKASKGQKVLFLFHDKEQILEHFIKEGIADCCPSSRPELNEFEVSAFVDSVSTYVSTAISALHNIKEVKPEILNIEDAEMHARIHIRGMNDLTESLFQCLIPNAPKEYVSGFEKMNQTLSNSFVDTKATYGI